MPDFAPNYTARFRMAYTVAGASHHLTWRLPSTTLFAGLVAVANKLHAFLDALDAKIYSDFTTTGYSYALADSDVFLPYTFAVWANGGVSPAGIPPSQKALALSFPGRSVAGHRAVFFLYGVATNPTGDPDSGDFRIHNVEDAAISLATGVLNETPPNLVANDDEEVVWYPYANVKFNDYWTRRVRQGA